VAAQCRAAERVGQLPQSTRLNDWESEGAHVATKLKSNVILTLVSCARVLKRG
jgi:hypothetical protein